MKLTIPFHIAIELTLFAFYSSPSPHTFDQPYSISSEISFGALFIDGTNHCLICEPYLNKLHPPSDSCYLNLSLTPPKRNLPYLLITRSEFGLFQYSGYYLTSENNKIDPQHTLNSLYIYSSLMSTLLHFPPSSSIFLYLLPR